MKAQGIVDKHYGALAQRALYETPKALDLEDETKSKFQDAFGISWEDGLTSGKIINLDEAIKTFPDRSETQLATAWRSGASVKLMPGTYIAKIDDYFVVNGFYADMVSSWKRESSNVLFYLVQWSEKDLSWTDFRGKLIGSTDPSKADQASIRGTLLREYQTRFGLEDTPTTTLNGVHASAGPIEGARECTIWCKMPSTHKFVLQKFAHSQNISPQTWEKGMDNAKISLQSGKKGLIFDVTEGMSAEQALDVLKEISSPHSHL